MDSNAIENISTSEIIIHFSTDLIEPRINAQEKGPSWDGELHYYCKPGKKGKKKKNRIGSCKVQIKGKTVKLKEMESETITYPVEIVDLNNFATEGGTLFFVVYIADKKNTAVYYATLLPYDIYTIINNLNDDNQISKSIELKKLPTDDVELLHHIVKQFIVDKKKQFGITPEYIKSLASNENPVTRNIPLTFETSPKYMFTDDIYFYHKHSPVAQSVVEKVRIKELSIPNSNAVLKVGGKDFFKGKIKAIFSLDAMTILLGSCLTIRAINIGKTNVNTQFNFKVSGTLDDVIEGIECALLIEQYQKFFISGFNECTVKNAGFDVNSLTKSLEIYKKTKDLFTALHVQNNVCVDIITEAEWNLLHTLYEAIIEQKPVKLNNVDSGYITAEVGGLKIALIAIKKDNTFIVLDAFQTVYPMKVVLVDDDNNNKVETSAFINLTKAFFIEYANINYDAILQSVITVPYNEVHCEKVTQMLLELLLAYDQEKDERMLKTAIDITEWLKNCQNTESNIINYYQCIIRKRELSDEEKRELIVLKNAIENSEMADMYLAAIAILLNEKAEFEFFFSKFTEEQKNQFIKFPLMNLLSL